MLCHSASFLGIFGHFENDSRNLAGMFLYTSAQQNPVYQSTVYQITARRLQATIHKLVHPPNDIMHFKAIAPTNAKQCSIVGVGCWRHMKVTRSSCGPRVVCYNTNGNMGYVKHENKAWHVPWYPTRHWIMKSWLAIIFVSIFLPNGRLSSDYPTW